MRQLRQGPVAYRSVIPRDIELGQGRAGIEDAVGMGEPDPLEYEASVASALRFVASSIPTVRIGPTSGCQTASIRSCG